jgi:glycine cleavage system aminomethyltransferase T
MSSELDLCKTPLNSWHHDNKGQMIDFGGWEMPVQYAEGILEEHLAVRKFGGLFDVSHMGRFRIKGLEINNLVFFIHMGTVYSSMMDLIHVVEC